MKVSEVIEKLKELPQDLHLYVPKMADNDFPEFQLVKQVDTQDLQIEDDMEAFVCIVE